MFRLFAAAAAACVLSGCAGDRALDRRDALRAHEEGLDAYRSAEGFGTVRWGMTQDEVRALLPDAVEVEPGLLVRNESVEGRPGQVAYVFEQGHLSRAVARLRPNDVTDGFDDLRDRLRKHFGSPWRSHDPRHSDDGAAIGAVVAVAVVAALLVGALILTKGGGKMDVPKVGSGAASAAAHGAHGAAGVVPRGAGIPGPAAPGGAVVAVPSPDVVQAVSDLVVDSARMAAWSEAERPPEEAAQTLLLSSWRTHETAVDLMARVAQEPELIVSYDSQYLRAWQ
jgi:hypothetical protein